MQCNKRIGVEKKNCLYYANPELNQDSEKGEHLRLCTDWGSSVTEHGLVISRPKSCVLYVPVRILWPGIRDVIERTSTVLGSRRIIPNIFYLVLLGL